jgi:hypothetical protein
MHPDCAAHLVSKFMVLPFFPRFVDSVVSGPEAAKNLAAEMSSA